MTSAARESISETKQSAPACRVCGSDRVVSLGAPLYRPPTKVAGVPIRVDDLNLSLYCCTQCGYQFVSPIVPEERLLACYRESGGKNWTTDPNVNEAIVTHRYYENKRRVLERFSPGRRVLDFGCYDGGFLRYLGDTWDRAGIEPSEVAAKTAASHDIKILGPTIESVDSEYDGTFDAILSFDVFEHLARPVETIKGLARLLRPGGVLVVETGNSEAISWRLTGRAYWYCGLVEHIGFFNRQSVETAGRLAGLELAHFERSYHTRQPFWFTLRSLAMAGVYLALRAARKLHVPLRGKLDLVSQGTMPSTFGVRDHFLAVLRRG
jgi:SAM-dependent methyltransferase